MKILILEDPKEDVYLIERALKRSGVAFTSSAVYNKEGFKQLVYDLNPDVILTDHSLPQFNSIEAQKIVQQYQTETKTKVPFILISGPAHFDTRQTDLINQKHKWSDEAYRIYGYDPGGLQVTYKTFLSHIHPEDRQPVKDAIDEPLPGDSNPCAFGIIDKTGKVKHFLSHVHHPIVRRE